MTSIVHDIALCQCKYLTYEECVSHGLIGLMYANHTYHPKQSLHYYEYRYKCIERHIVKANEKYKKYVLSNVDRKINKMNKIKKKCPGISDDELSYILGVNDNVLGYIKLNELLFYT